MTRVFRSYFRSVESFTFFRPLKSFTSFASFTSFTSFTRVIPFLLLLACPGAAEAQIVSYAFVPNSAGPTKVTVIDTATHTIVPSSITTPSGPTAAGASPDGRVVYLLSDVVTIVDVHTQTVTGTIAVGNTPWDVAFTQDGTKAYVVNGGTPSSISIIDVGTHTVSGTIPLPGTSFPRNIAITADGLMAYVSSNLGTYPVDLATNTVGTVIPTGVSYGIAILPGEQAAFVADRNNGVWVVDLVNQTVSATPIPTAGTPSNMKLSRDGTFVYVANADSPGSVSAIDVTTHNVIATIPAGRYPHNLSFTPDGRYAYVPNDDDNDVTVIDTATHTVHGSPIPVGGDPFALGGDFITPNIITSTGGPLAIANDAALEAAGFRSFVPFYGGTLTLSGDWTTARHLSMLAFSGTIDTNGFDAAIAGNVINDGMLFKTANGRLTFADTSTATHAGTQVYGGGFAVHGLHSAPLEMFDGTVSGTGTLGNVTVYFGTVSPGNGDGTGEIGVLRASQLTIGIGGTLIIEINDAGAADYDRVEVSGTANIDNATLTISSVFSLPPAAQFTILTNATGHFQNLPEGAIIHGTGVSGAFRISYVGGDGNDVVLTHDEAPALAFLTAERDFPEDAGLVIISFDIVEDVVDPSDVILTVISHNQTLLPSANASIVGTGVSRALHVTTTPNASGVAGITLRVSDGATLVQYSFSLTIGAVNDAPTISPVAPQSVPENMPLDPVTFTVGDVESDPADLTVTATSSNHALVPDANLTLGGSGATRTIAATPLVGVRGETTITLTVSDGSASTSTTFTLTVTERTYYLAEGATGAFFDTDILLANPNAIAAPVVIRFLKEDGSSIVESRTLEPMSRTTIRADEIAGLESTAFATIVTSTEALPIVVERTMRWDATGYGAHTEKATAGAAPTWYFAEGAQGFFSTYFLLANPHAAPNTAHVTYFREGAPVITRDYPLAAGSRFTIDAGADVELRDQAFGARVTFDLPGVAERAMYFGAGPLWLGGHASAGATAAASDWFLAEGATGTYFTTFVLIANPNDEPADVTVRYLPETGAEVTRTYTIAAGQRLTRNVVFEDPSLANAAIATHVQSTRPVVVERAQYWGQPAWIEAHNSFGITSVAPRWGLAEGRVGGADQASTYILLANAGADPANVTVTFLRADGTTLVKAFTVPAATRFNVAITPGAGAGSMAPELVDESFGALIESTQPIVVERSVYRNANGITWGAGTNATATRLP